MKLFKLFLSGAFLLTAITGISAQKTRVPANPAPAQMLISDRIDTIDVLEKIAPRKSDAADAKLESAAGAELITAGTYGFTATTTTLEDMSAGTTQIVGPSQDDTASLVNSIGFDFWYDGVRQTQFSTNANGLMRFGPTAVSTGFANDLDSVTDAPKLSAYWDDMCTGATGKIHYKTIGSAPNRKTIVEFLNMKVTRNGTCTAPVGNGTFQIWLFETTGVIQFVYSALPASAATDTGYSVGLQSGVATNFASVTTSSASVSYAAANDTQTTAITAGTSFVFTPNVPLAPTGNGVNAQTPTSQTLNWIDNATNEFGYAVYRSIDNVNFTFIAQTAANATSFTDTGLSPNSPYFYRVRAVTEGALSSAASLAGNTTVAATDTCLAGGGGWNTPGTWADGSVPTVNDNVVIQSSCQVVIDTNAVAANVTVQGVLQFDAAAQQSLTMSGNLTVDSFGTFQTALSGGIANHALNMNANAPNTGNIVNNGNLDFSTNGDTAGAIISFTGPNNSTFSGTGAITDVQAITVNKGTTNEFALELMPSNFTVRGVTTDSAGFLTLTNGTFKVSGTFTNTNRVFTTAAYTIGATTQLWLNNPNFTIAGQNGAATLNGMLRMTQGTYNIGTSANDSMGFGPGGSVILIEGGAVNAAGRFGVAAAANPINYTQTGGTITVETVGNTSTTLAGFDMGQGAGSLVTMSGGTIVCQLANTAGTGPRDYRHQAGTAGIATVNSPATVQFGNAASGTAKAFNAAGVFPNLVVNTASAGHSVTFLAAAVFNNITQDITIGTGGTFSIGSNVFLFNGLSIVNNGTLTANLVNSRFITFRAGASCTYSGTGVSSGVMSSFETQTDNFTFNPSVTNIVVRRVIIFVGNIINSNKLTIGDGSVTANVIQIGNSAAPATNAGTFDSAPSFNLGTGSQNISYLFTTNSYTTGPEINPTRVINNLTYNDGTVGHTLTIAGGNLTAAGTLTLTAGVIVTGSNTLTHNGTATRTAGFVDGTLARNYLATGAYTYHVGQGGYTPVAATITALGINPSTLSVRSFNNTLAGFPAGQSLSRNWQLEENGDLTATLSFTYDTDANDVNGTEANYRIWKRDSAGTATDMCGAACVNTATNTLGPLVGVTTFSRWTGAEAITPTAAQANISGRVMTSSGIPIANAKVVLTGGGLPSAVVVYTGSMGYYYFEGLSVGQNYVVTVKSRRFSFSDPSHLVNLQDNVMNGDFIADPVGSRQVPKNPPENTRER